MLFLQRTDRPIFAVDASIAAASTLDVPLEFLDLAWLPAGGDRWTARRTPLAEIALDVAGRGLRRLGFEGSGALVVWDLAKARGEPNLAGKLQTWDRVVRGEHARRQAREAACRPVDDEALAQIQAALEDALARHGWSFRSKVGLAEGFARAARLTPGQAQFARALLHEARDVMAAVDRRLAEPAGLEDLAAARDLDHRADLLEACRLLSDLDGDRARDRNGEGWSAVASGPGHRLAATDSLTALEAAHARPIVFAHRRQLPAELRERLGF